MTKSDEQKEPVDEKEHVEVSEQELEDRVKESQQKESDWDLLLKKYAEDSKLEETLDPNESKSYKSHHPDSSLRKYESGRGADILVTYAPESSIQKSQSDAYVHDSHTPVEQVSLSHDPLEKKKREYQTGLGDEQNFDGI